MRNVPDGSRRVLLSFDRSVSRICAIVTPSVCVVVRTVRCSRDPSSGSSIIECRAEASDVSLRQRQIAHVGHRPLGLVAEDIPGHDVESHTAIVPSNDIGTAAWRQLPRVEAVVQRPVRESVRAEVRAQSLGLVGEPGSVAHRRFPSSAHTTARRFAIMPGDVSGTSSRR